MSGDGETYRYPHPFTVPEGWRYHRDNDELDNEDTDSPRTLMELRMCALSAAIREKKDWCIKFRVEEIQSKWRKEIAEQQPRQEGLAMTDNMINYIMGELEAYAALRDPETGIEVGPYERTWKSDSLIPPSLKAALIDAVAPLEAVPEDQKDWHPGSNSQVLDLVHPSLYPIVYGRTLSPSSVPLAPPANEDQFTSKQFQWLPSDFAVAAGGAVRLASPYINNVDSDALAWAVTQVVERAVPMFERVLSDLAREQQLPTRMDLGGRNFPVCVWGDNGPPEPPDDLLEQIDAEAARRVEEARVRGENVRRGFEWECRDELLMRWRDAQPKCWPDSKLVYEGGLDDVKKNVDLRGKTLQVIVKLANIVLTPEKPEYAGGSWHVEGMKNEAIVASFIYYYDCQNVTDATLSFRAAVCEPRYHMQDDNYCMEHLYGINGNDECVQVVGHVATCGDRCVAFPNVYQHRVGPFRLRDARRGGHRKILVLFLVDPHVRVPGASDVAPQQAVRIRAAVEGTLLWERLPVELREIVWGLVGAMEEGEAREHRAVLMAERTRFVQTVNGQKFGKPFNMCEH